MPRSKTSDITNEFKKMRKCKIIELLKSPDIDLTDEELNIFLLRLNYYNDGVSEKVGKCPRSVTTIFMNVLNKIRDFKKVLVYTWLISFLTVLFLACAGFLILDGRIDSNYEKINAIAVGLIEESIKSIPD